MSAPRGRKSGAALGLTVALSLAGASHASAGIADPDPGFGDGGTATIAVPDAPEAPGVELLSDGDLMIFGSVRPAGGDSESLLLRLDPDGSPDSGFSGDGVLELDLGEGLDESTVMVGADAGGAALVAARVGTGPEPGEGEVYVERVLADGSRDDTYGGAGAVRLGDAMSGLHDLGVDDSGRGVILGESIDLDDDDDDVSSVVARLMATGELDQAYGEGGLESTHQCYLTNACLEINGWLRFGPEGDPDPLVEIVEVGGDPVLTADVAVRPDGSYYQLVNDWEAYGAAPPFSVSLIGAGEARGWPYPSGRAFRIAALDDGRAVLTGSDGGPRAFLLDPQTEAGFAGSAALAAQASDVTGVPGGGYVTAHRVEGAGVWVVSAFLPPSVDASGVTKPPRTQIVKAPKRAIQRRAVTFRFRADTDDARFDCKLDRKRWRRCDSPVRYRRLRVGRHTFRVRAIANGKADPTPAKRRFLVR